VLCSQSPNPTTRAGSVGDAAPGTPPPIVQRYVSAQRGVPDVLSPPPMRQATSGSHVAPSMAGSLPSMCPAGYGPVAPQRMDVARMGSHNWQPIPGPCVQGLPARQIRQGGVAGLPPRPGFREQEPLSACASAAVEPLLAPPALHGSMAVYPGEQFTGGGGPTRRYSGERLGGGGGSMLVTLPGSPPPDNKQRVLHRLAAPWMTPRPNGCGLAGGGVHPSTSYAGPPRPLSGALLTASPVRMTSAVAAEPPMSAAEGKLRSWLSTMSSAGRPWDEAQIVEIRRFAQDHGLEHLSAEEMYGRYVEHTVDLAEQDLTG